MDPVSGRLHHRLEVAAGLRHAPARFAHSRLSDSIQPQDRLPGSTTGAWSTVRAPSATDISRFHKIPDGAIYQTSCAPCHTSQLRNGGPRRGVAPGSHRRPCSVKGASTARCVMGRRASTSSASSRAAQRTRAHLDTPVSFARLPAAQYVAVCSAMPCAVGGAQRAMNGGNVNYSDQVPFYRAYPTCICRRTFRAKRSTATAATARRRSSARRSRARSVSGKGTRPAVHATIRILPTPPRTRRL